MSKSETTRPKPSDDELRGLWTRAVRLSRPWRGSLAHRLAYGIADDLEARGVTDEDIDRVEATLLKLTEEGRAVVKAGRR